MCGAICASCGGVQPEVEHESAMRGCVDLVSLNVCQHCSCTSVHILCTPANVVTSALGSSLQQNSHPRYRITTFIQLSVYPEGEMANSGTLRCFCFKKVVWESQNSKIQISLVRVSSQKCPCNPPHPAGKAPTPQSTASQPSSS